MRGSWRLALALVLAGAASNVSAAVCATSTSAAPRLERLTTAMAQGRFIAYTPSSMQLVNGRPARIDPNTIRADLQLLRPRFDSLVTYGALNGAEAIPAIAASLGFRALIIGVYDPFDATELNAALAAAHSQPSLVVGLALGNELLFFHHHNAREFDSLIDSVHARAPQLPLSTTEPFQVYYEPALSPLLARMDFLLANAHPIFQPWFHSASNSDAAQFVVNVVAKLATAYCGPILVKETGIPTAPAEKGYTEQRQAAFYEELLRHFPPSRQRAFVFFAAFDAPWRLNDLGPIPGQRPAPEEAHWGLYDENRAPKVVISRIPPLPLDRERVPPLGRPGLLLRAAPEERL